MLPSIVYSDIKKVLYKNIETRQEAQGMEARQETTKTIYIDDKTLYIKDIKYSFTLNIDNIIKLKRYDFNKIIEMIKDNKDIIKELLKVYDPLLEKRFSINEELEAVYKTSLQKGRNEKQLNDTIKGNIKALHDIIKDSENITKEEKTYKLLKQFTSKKDVKPVLKEISQEGGRLYATDSYIIARTTKSDYTMPHIENYPKVEKLFNDIINKLSENKIYIDLKKLEQLKLKRVLQDNYCEYEDFAKNGAIIKFKFNDNEDIYFKYSHLKKALKATKSNTLILGNGTLKPAYMEGNGFQVCILPCKMY